MLDALRNLFRKEAPPIKPPPRNSLECPVCGSGRFFEGPAGGACMNMSCVECGHWVNVLFLPNGPQIIDNDLHKVLPAEQRKSL